MDRNKQRHKFLHVFGLAVMVLALARCAFPHLAQPTAAPTLASADTTGAAMSPVTTETSPTDAAMSPTTTETSPTDAAMSPTTTAPLPADATPRYIAEGERPHPIRSVPSYAAAFPDSNHVQLAAARQWGVSPVSNRADAEARKTELVYMGSSPYYTVARLDASIPYLVPRAAILLDDIGRAFFDSLQLKGLPLHRITVSSVLRTQADVERLRQVNRNATELSCHLYGTTFDISYNVYQPVTPREVGNDKLKYVLSEVLNDLRQQGRCYIKYEVREPCFHITVR